MKLNTAQLPKPKNPNPTQVPNHPEVDKQTIARDPARTDGKPPATRSNHGISSRPRLTHARTHTRVADGQPNHPWLLSHANHTSHPSNTDDHYSSLAYYPNTDDTLILLLQYAQLYFFSSSSFLFLFFLICSCFLYVQSHWHAWPIDPGDHQPSVTCAVPFSKSKGEWQPKEKKKNSLPSSQRRWDTSELSEREEELIGLCTPFPWLKMLAKMRKKLKWKRLSRSVPYHGEAANTARRLLMYTDTSLLLAAPPSVTSRSAVLVARTPARKSSSSSSSPSPPPLSLLQPQRRRVVVVMAAAVGGLDEDGPEYLHVLARARLHVLVQDVDPSLCMPPHKPKHNNHKQEEEEEEARGYRRDRSWRTLPLGGMHADPELLERREERLEPAHGPSYYHSPTSAPWIHLTMHSFTSAAAAAVAAAITKLKNRQRQSTPIYALASHLPSHLGGVVREERKRGREEESCSVASRLGEAKPLCLLILCFTIPFSQSRCPPPSLAS